MLIHVNVSILIPVREWLAQKPVRPSKETLYINFWRDEAATTGAHITAERFSSPSTYYKWRVIIIRISQKRT